MFLKSIFLSSSVNVKKPEIYIHIPIEYDNNIGKLMDELYVRCIIPREKVADL